MKLNNNIRVTPIFASLSCSLLWKNRACAPWQTQMWVGRVMGYSFVLRDSSGQPREPWVHNNLYEHTCKEKVKPSTFNSTALNLQRLVSSFCLIAIWRVRLALQMDSVFSSSNCLIETDIHLLQLHLGSYHS